MSSHASKESRSWHRHHPNPEPDPEIEFSEAATDHVCGWESELVCWCECQEPC